MKWFALVVGVVLMAGAQSNRGQPRTDPALNKLADDFADAFNAKDAAKVAAFYADDAVVMPPDQPMVKGRPNIEAYYRRGFGQDVSNFRLLPMESVIDGRQAFEAGSSRLTARRSASSLGGPALVTAHGKYVVVYKRVGDGWKIAYDIFNTD